MPAASKEAGARAPRTSAGAKPLIIAEKPSAARAIAEALGGFARREGYLESDRYLLSWAVGHLVEQLAPEEYDPKWKRWALESLPILPEKFGLKVVSKTKSQFDVIARLARQAPELINACDAGREGELIFRFIQHMAGARQPSRRLWVSALTPDAIRRAFAVLKPSHEYDRLYASALCRAQGDWLVGMNGTRAFTVKWGELYSVGRVQTPTLALIVRREREFEAFVPEDYWEVFAEFATTTGGDRYPGKWFGPDGDRLKKAEDAQAIADRVKGQPGTVESAEEKEVSERPPQLYDLTTLQRDANRRFGLTAAATLKAAQSLYEAKLITYPRTDSRYLSRDLVSTLPGVVRAAGAFQDLGEIAQNANLALVHPANRRVVDDSKVTDHHAIIPTAERASSLSGVEAKIYGLIARRFLAQFYPEARYRDMEVITVCGPVADRFRSRGRRVLDPGWRVVEPEPERKKGEEEEEASPLPKLAAGDRVVDRKVEVKQKQTQPPKRYSEAALLSAMEFAGREMDDEALKEAMKGHGLGTPATRAAIIERLKEVGYITLDKKVLIPTPKGRQLVALAETAGAQVLLSPELTGGWEKQIADIQAGAFEADRFMKEIRNLAVQVVEWVRKAPGSTPGALAAPAGVPAPARRTRRKVADAPEAEVAATAEDELPAFAGKCPRCGRAVIKGSRAWICANHDCTLRIPTYLCGKVLDVAVATDLITKGRTKLITGFKSPRNGKTFSAYLLLKDGKVEFEFPKDKPRQRRSTTPSGYRRNPTGGTARESTAGTKTGSRAAGGARSARSGSSHTGAAGARVGGRAPRASKPAGDGAR